LQPSHGIPASGSHPLPSSHFDTNVEISFDDHLPTHLPVQKGEPGPMLLFMFIHVTLNGPFFILCLCIYNPSSGSGARKTNALSIHFRPSFVVLHFTSSFPVQISSIICLFFLIPLLRSTPHTWNALLFLRLPVITLPLPPIPLPSPSIPSFPARIYSQFKFQVRYNIIYTRTLSSFLPSLPSFLSIFMFRSCV
ncbi:hypothetical protein CVT26_005695, partial [Gymnopilus dilepis]